MFNLMTQNWWAMALRGVIAILFGLAALMLPGFMLWALVALFGAYALVDGIFAVIESFRRDARGERWWALLFEGVVGIVVGILTFIWPGLTAMGLIYLIAFWAVVTGAFEVITAVRLRHAIRGEWLMALIGVLSMALGALLAIFPVAGALSVVWMIGAYAVAAGVLMIALGFKLRSLRHPSAGTTHARWVAPSH
ncbi:MAG TPA: HdeD family acid-resistance protein [Blastocatellia bacterium]